LGCAASEVIAVFQRISRRGPSQSERKQWWIEGALIVAGVLLIGGFILWVLR